MQKYHAAYRAIDSVGTEQASFDYECSAVDYWVGSPKGVEIQYWNGNEWEDCDPRTFSAD